MTQGTHYSVGSYSEIYFQWEEISQDLAKGVTRVAWQLVLKAKSNGAINSSTQKAYTVKVNGQTYSGKNKVGIANNTTKILVSGETYMSHDANGKKTFNYSFSQEFGFYSESLKKQITTIEGKGSGTLQQIQAYPVIKTAPNFSYGDNPTITFDLKGYDYTKVAVCISLTKAKSDISYRYIPANTNQYTFNLTENEYQILNHSLTSRSRTVYFFVRTTIGKDSKGNDIYNHSYLPVTYTYGTESSLTITNDSRLWTVCSTFLRENSAKSTAICDADESLAFCTVSYDHLWIALNYESYLNLHGTKLNEYADIEFYGQKITAKMGPSCSTAPQYISDCTFAILQLWNPSMFIKESAIVDDLKITFYNNIGDKVTTSRKIKVLKYNQPSFTATVSRLTDTMAQIRFNVSYSQFEYIDKDKGITPQDNSVDISVTPPNGSIWSSQKQGNSILVTVGQLNSKPQTVTGYISDRVKRTDFEVVIPQLKRPININTQAVAIGDMIQENENDGRFKCGWDAYFTGAIHHKYPELLYTYNAAAYFKAEHSFTLSNKKALANQPNGYLIEWCYIEKNNQGGYDRYTGSGLNYTFIPRCIPEPSSGGHISLSFPLYDYARVSGVKGVLVTTHTSTTTTIKGVNENGDSPNNQWAIYRVFGI